MAPLLDHGLLRVHGLLLRLPVKIRTKQTKDALVPGVGVLLPHAVRRHDVGGSVAGPARVVDDVADGVSQSVIGLLAHRELPLGFILSYVPAQNHKINQ